MNQQFPVKKAGKPRVLVAPLDWGLGHASRMIPVIRELLEQGADVWLAGEGAQEVLLRQEFPVLPFLTLRGYRVRYPRKGRAMTLKILKQWPGIMSVIRQENAWLKKAVSDYRIDAVISDNRYGLYHAGIPCVFITHQLQIKSPWSLTSGILNRMNYRYIRRFTACWVPDLAGEKNLAGELSHPEKLPGIPISYLGALTRLRRLNIEEEKNHLLIILSGPEPQRSLLEEIIIGEISHYAGTATIVRGLPGNTRLLPSTGMLEFHNHLGADDLNREMQRASMVISRSGYSTVMDAALLQKKCIFIPTPGQTEQEYLAGYLQFTKRALQINQEAFSLSKALMTANKFPYEKFPEADSGKLKKVIADFLAQLPADSLG